MNNKHPTLEKRGLLLYLRHLAEKSRPPENSDANHLESSYHCGVKKKRRSVLESRGGEKEERKKKRKEKKKKKATARLICSSETFI